MSPLHQNLRRARLRLGWALDDLAEAAQHIVSKQMLSKYEQGTAAPSQKVLFALAAALRMPASELLTNPTVKVDFVAFRKHSDLPKKEEEKIKAEIELQINRRRELSAALGEPLVGWRLRSLTASRVEDAERHAVEVRAEWGLGLHPIANLTATVESEGVEVFVVRTHEKFSGISAWTSDRQPIAVVQFREADGARQRFDLAHELAHLVLSPHNSFTTAKEEEQYAQRFAGAFLFPESCVVAEFGTRRTRVTKAELQRIKLRFGLSMQAVVRRARDCGVLGSEGYDFWVRHFSRVGRKVEEGPAVPTETPGRPLRLSARAVGERLLSRVDAERLSGLSLPDLDDDQTSEAPIEEYLAPQLRFLAMDEDERQRAIFDESRADAEYYRKNPESLLPDFYDEPESESTPG